MLVRTRAVLGETNGEPTECVAVKDRARLGRAGQGMVKRACAEQGVAVTITDPLVLAEIAGILRSGREKWESGPGNSPGPAFRNDP